MSKNPPLNVEEVLAMDDFGAVVHAAQAIKNHGAHPEVLSKIRMRIYGEKTQASEVVTATFTQT